MNQVKNIFIFDAFLSGSNAYSFFESIPGKFSVTEIVNEKKTEKLHSKMWKEVWHFYTTREPFKYIPEHIRLPNGSDVVGCLHVIDLGVYSYLIDSFTSRFGQNGQINLHNDMADDDLNSIKWARYYGLTYAVVVLEDEKKLAFDYIHQIKRIYGLSDEDILFNINTKDPNTIFTGLDHIIKYFESRFIG